MNEHYEYLRKQKADYISKMEKQSFPEIEQLKSECYHNATILPLKKSNKKTLVFGLGGVVDSNNIYIEESAVKGRVEYAYEYDSYDCFDEKVVFCGYLINHWGHFLTETVPRLWYVLENDKSIDKYVFFIEESIEREPTGNFKEFLQLLGIYDKVQVINKPTRYKDVIVPQLSYKRREYYSQRFKEIFRKVCNSITFDSTWSIYNKIYFARSQTAGAGYKEFGHDCMESFFSNNGYKIIYPEKISLSELIYIISNAEKIATVCGTLQHNILFAQENKDVAILERNVIVNDIQLDVNIIKKAKYVYIDSHHTVYNVSEGFGPFMMYFTEELKKYAEDNHMVYPDKSFFGEKYKKTILRNYFQVYLLAYDYSVHLEKWHYNQIQIINEAVKSAESEFYNYIHRSKPIFLRDYLDIRFQKFFIHNLFYKISSIFRNQ